MQNNYRSQNSDKGQTRQYSDRQQHSVNDRPFNDKCGQDYRTTKNKRKHGGVGFKIDTSSVRKSYFDD
ncbi:hypothetical protein SS50377_25559 [Spironucleus salmonicida]|uniref:Uncharacterized protein n=1 Tax=Spironucleus salmonicida TaxID=348837 RepID=V6LKK6_9EUKA|nr:hypothetical protein SS50377_25559 [Spironucleus salmonicida]|eukprot:EST45107.1 Hypothetical protein SS50377_15127 [Spironucleus salmonicida]